MQVTGVDMQQRAPGRGLEPGAAAARTKLSVHGMPALASELILLAWTPSFAVIKESTYSDSLQGRYRNFFIPAGRRG